MKILDYIQGKKRIFLIIAIICILLIFLYFVFFFPNKWERMANQYVDFLFDEYEGRTVYILEAFLFDGDYGTNENLERDEGWYDCLLKISAGGENSRVYYVIMTHTKGDFFMIGNIIDISEVEYFRDMDWIGNINMRKIHNSHTFVF